MDIATSIHHVTNVEKVVTVFNEGKPSQFTTVAIIVTQRRGDESENTFKFTLFVEDGASAVDVIGNGEFTYAKAN